MSRYNFASRGQVPEHWESLRNRIVTDSAEKPSRPEIARELRRWSAIGQPVTIPPEVAVYLAGLLDGTIKLPPGRKRTPPDFDKIEMERQTVAFVESRMGELTADGTKNAYRTACDEASEILRKRGISLSASAIDKLVYPEGR